MIEITFLYRNRLLFVKNYYLCSAKYSNITLIRQELMEKFNADLKFWLDSLGRVDRMRASKLICEACKVKRKKLYNWTSGSTKVEPLYQDQINEVRQSFA